jgi:NAD-dependent deacetylase
LFIVLGSSLQVSPANFFPQLAKRNGAKLVIINMGPTPLDSMADLVIHECKIGDVLKEANEKNRELYEQTI